MRAFFVLLCLLFAQSQPALRPVAMIVEIIGSVQVSIGNVKPQRLSPGDGLYAGDIVQLAGGGEVKVLLFSDGRRERIKQGPTVSVQASGFSPKGESLSGPKLNTKTLVGLSDQCVSAKGGGHVIRGQDPPSPLDVSPLFDSAVISDRPILRWTGTALADAYQVRVKLLGAKNFLWTALSKKTELEYPPGEAALIPPNYYEWEVRPIIGKEIVDSIVKSSFSIVPIEEKDAIADFTALVADGNLDNLLLAARGYEMLHVYDEALKLFERLAKLSPTEPVYQMRLAVYYDRAGKTDLAKKARAKAKELSGNK